MMPTMKPSPLDSLPLPARRFVAASVERRRPIAAFVLAVMALSVAVALLLPPWYRAQSTVLPPTEGNDSFGIMAGLIQGAALSKIGMTTTSTASEIYAEILMSRTLQEDLVRTFQLDRRYKRKGMDLTLKELGRHVKVVIGTSGLLVVQVEDRDAQRAAAMANRLVDELDRFNRETLNTRAKRTREFLESRVADVQTRMRAAEAALTAYERKHGVVADASAVGGMAAMIAQKLSLQVKREYVSSYTSVGNSAVRSIDAEIAAYDRELARLPGLKNEGARLALDAEIQRRVFTMLTGQYEDARVQEMRDTPTITVLDRARPPELKSRPKRSVIVLAATLVALLLSVGWVGMSLRKAAPA
jgi:tyrosine-protein kinase Etk/Wzc